LDFYEKEFQINGLPIIVLTISDSKDSPEVIKRYVTDFLHQNRDLLQALVFYHPLTEEENLKAQKVIGTKSILSEEAINNNLYSNARRLLEDVYTRNSWRFKHNGLVGLLTSSIIGIIIFTFLVNLFQQMSVIFQLKSWEYVLLSALLVGLITGMGLGFFAGARDILKKSALITTIYASGYLYLKYGSTYEAFHKFIGWGLAYVFIFTILLIGTGFAFMYAFGWWIARYIENKTFRV